ncbi:MAG: hypothetical protein EPO64_03000 [Nitrospirae bacterium]|nr:MAG: hypothetical protein EPO64_03000 [Nitrospirota bacterium]
MITNMDPGVDVVLAKSSPVRQERSVQPVQTTGAEPTPAPKIDLPTYGITLRVDDGTHEVIAVIVDRDTQRVIREIPSEEMRIAAKVIRNLISRHVDTLA